jgi:tRNA A37 methylthiotransferase MiaB
MDVLNSMNRGWSGFGSVVEMLARFRQDNPFVALGGDFIVGFPGESEAMFQETLEKTDVVGFTYGHVFRYSPRPQTSASEMGGHIPASEKTQRSSKLRMVLGEARNRFAQQMVGKTVRIIVEKRGEIEGKTSNYLPVTVPGECAPKGEWYETLIERYNKGIGKCMGRRPVEHADGR